MVYFEGNILYEVIQEIEVIVHIVPGSNEAPHFQRVQLTGLKTRMSSRGTGVILINHAMGSSWHSTKPGARGCTWGETSLVRIQAGGWTVNNTEVTGRLYWSCHLTLTLTSSVLTQALHGRLPTETWMAIFQHTPAKAISFTSAFRSLPYHCILVWLLREKIKVFPE